MKDELNLPCECGGTAVLCWSLWGDKYSYRHKCVRCQDESISYDTPEESASAWMKRMSEAIENHFKTQ
ncbi:hypothetical protein C5467_19445 [Photorhabdus khanii subsp. guanajuatensis]|uniref:Restriction alleviation protein, Lar family n=1 Tax=Photorhabdus khanii subsp. guanajuatensis TaxID=2100166 RepID=A0A4R4J6B5_9GAMM|nr:hypothetical protein C5467_19445 [Photorhabdus khanii subsp. guanajuatensis]